MLQTGSVKGILGFLGCRSLSTRAAADVVIVGSGVVGTSIALSMTRKGYNTINVDSLAASGSGSTSYSSGIIRMWYSVIDSIKLAGEGYEYFKDWDKFIGVKDPLGMATFRECGGLLLRSPEATPFLNKVLPLFDELNIEYSHLSNEEISKRYAMDMSLTGPPRLISDPEFGTPNGGMHDGGVYVPQAGYVSDPRLAVHNLQVAAEATGRAQFLFNKSVVKVLTKGGGEVHGITLDDGTEIHAPIVVNAAGPHSSAINEMIFNAVGNEYNDMMPTKPLRQEVAYVRSPPEVDSDKDLPMIQDLDTGVYMRPEVGNKILIGSTEPACDEMHYLERPEDMHNELTDQWTNQVYRAALRFPTMELPSGKETMGITALYDVTPDWTPIYDKTAVKGYFVAIGTSGNQFKNAGPIGVMMSEIIDTTHNNRLDHDDTPIQFELTRSKRGHINSGSFSRRRKMLDTAKNVLG